MRTEDSLSDCFRTGRGENAAAWIQPGRTDPARAYQSGEHRHPPVTCHSARYECPVRKLPIRRGCGGRRETAAVRRASIGK